MPGQLQNASIRLAGCHYWRGHGIMHFCVPVYNILDQRQEHTVKQGSLLWPYRAGSTVLSQCRNTRSVYLSSRRDGGSDAAACRACGWEAGWACAAGG